MANVHAKQSDITTGGQAPVTCEMTDVQHQRGPLQLRVNRLIFAQMGSVLRCKCGLVRLDWAFLEHFGESAPRSSQHVAVRIRLHASANNLDRAILRCTKHDQANTGCVRR
jgi:hypothetical protein